MAERKGKAVGSSDLKAGLSEAQREIRGKKYRLVSAMSSWHRAPKMLVISP